MADIHADGGVGAVSDSVGRFFLDLLPPGVTGFTVRHIGFAEASFTVRLPPDSTLVLAVTLGSLQALNTVRVEAAPESRRLQQFGFFERQHSTVGSFVSPARVDSLSYLGSPAQLLRGVRGLDVRCGMGGCAVHTFVAPDCLWLFVDGAFMDAQLDDVLTTSAVYAFEVYERPSIVPVEFQAKLPPKRPGGWTFKAGCGALVVWTRAHAQP